MGLISFASTGSRRDTNNTAWHSNADLWLPLELRLKSPVKKSSRIYDKSTVIMHGYESVGKQSRRCNNTKNEVVAWRRFRAPEFLVPTC